MVKFDAPTADTILLQVSTAVPHTFQGDETYITGYSDKPPPSGSPTQQRNDLLNKLSLALARVGQTTGPGQAKLSAILNRLQNSALSINPDDPNAALAIAGLYSQEEGCAQELDKLLGVTTEEKDPLKLAYLQQLQMPEARLEMAISAHYLIKPMDEHIAKLTVLHQESIIIHKIVEEGVREINEGIKDLKTTLSVAKALEVDDVDTVRKVKEEAIAEMKASTAKEVSKLRDEGASSSELDAYLEKSRATREKRVECIDEAAADLRQEGDASGFRKAYERFVVQPTEKLRQRHAEASAEAGTHPDRETRKLVESINAFHNNIDKSASLAQMENTFNEHVKTVYDHSDAAGREALMNTEYRNKELDTMVKARQSVSMVLSGHHNEDKHFAEAAAITGMKEADFRKEVSTFRRKHHLVAVPVMTAAQGQERPAR